MCAARSASELGGVAEGSALDSSFLLLPLWSFWPWMFNLGDANSDFRYQLTPVGQFAQVMVASDLDAMIARRIRDPGLHQRKEWNFDIGEGGCYRGGR